MEKVLQKIRAELGKFSKETREDFVTGVIVLYEDGSGHVELRKSFQNYDGERIHEFSNSDELLKWGES
jgi:hypothetical protein